MSRSGTEIDAYNNLSAKLVEVNKKLKQIDQSAMKEADKKHLMALEAAMMLITRQCKSKAKDASELWANAKEAMKAFNDKYNPEHSAAAAVVVQNPLNGVDFDMQSFFSGEISAPVKKSPPPLPASITLSHTMFGHEDSTSSNKKQKEKIVMKPESEKIDTFLNDRSGDVELSSKMVKNLDKELPEVICMMVSHMVDTYRPLIEKFIPAADNQDRKAAAIQLLADLQKVQGVLKSEDPMTAKVGAVKMMRANFETAQHNSSLDGKDLLNRTLTSKIFHASKVSAVSIFSRWDKEKIPFDSMVDTLEAKVRLAIQKPSSPRAGSGGE
jgi:hypothetical protein